ncbi:uncharacterized protein LOC144318572 isoform X2 [Canis aureus]
MLTMECGPSKEGRRWRLAYLGPAYLVPSPHTFQCCLPWPTCMNYQGEEQTSSNDSIQDFPGTALSAILCCFSLYKSSTSLICSGPEGGM